jgi:hypothetical protein
VITNPNAAVIIYSYRDRLGSEKITSDNSVDENEAEEMIITTELISVRTNKVKSAPAGNFEIQLAPSVNWITAITPGSWCVILMSRDSIEIPSSSISSTSNAANTQNSNDTAITQQKSDSPNIVKESELRMVGRVDSVRLSSLVSQDGTISSAYIVTGVDWGSIFDSCFYIDQIFKTNFDNREGGIILSKIYEHYMAHGSVDKKKTKNEDTQNLSSEEPVSIPPLENWTTTSTMQTLLLIWGNSKKFASEKGSSTENLLGKALNQFSIPEKLARYLGFVEDGNVITAMSELIKFRGGVLIDKDTYSDKDKTSDLSYSDGVCFLQAQTLYSMNTMWQILAAHSNPTLNEMLCDIRFEDGKPNFTLYKRIKPFAIKDPNSLPQDEVFFKETDDSKTARENSRSYAKSLLSNFKNIKRVDIDLEDIISINAGTNWKDRVNFIEVRSGRSEPFFQAINIWGRSDFQIFDPGSVRRDGLLPMIGEVFNMPFTVDRKGVDYNNIAAYKYLLREWFFDTHKMLNGSISTIGQDQYIQIGDNILIPAKVLGASYNYSSKENEDYLAGQDLYLLAHVESISHNALVDPNGARSFITDIQFVRGIMVSTLGLDGDINTTLDQDRYKMNGAAINNSVTTSSYPLNNKKKSSTDKGN